MGRHLLSIVLLAVGQTSWATPEDMGNLSDLSEVSFTFSSSDLELPPPSDGVALAVVVSDLSISEKVRENDGFVLMEGRRSHPTKSYIAQRTPPPEFPTMITTKSLEIVEVPGGGPRRVVLKHPPHDAEYVLEELHKQLGIISTIRDDGSIHLQDAALLEDPDWPLNWPLGEDGTRELTMNDAYNLLQRKFRLKEGGVRDFAEPRARYFFDYPYDVIWAGGEECAEKPARDLLLAMLTHMSSKEDRPISFFASYQETFANSTSKPTVWKLYDSDPLRMAGKDQQPRKQAAPVGEELQNANQ